MTTPPNRLPEKPSTPVTPSPVSPERSDVEQVQQTSQHSFGELHQCLANHRRDSFMGQIAKAACVGCAAGTSKLALEYVLGKKSGSDSTLATVAVVGALTLTAQQKQANDAAENTIADAKGFVEKLMPKQES